MFIGHYAAAFAAKRASPQTSLGTLFLASQFTDLLWPVLLVVGWEHLRIDPGNTAFSPIDFTDYPYSHSLAAVLFWSVLTAGIFYALRRSRRGALVVGLLVASHWLLDLVVHGPDLPLGLGGETRVGLGLWNSVAGTLIVETGLFLAGIAIYLATTRPKDRIGIYGFWGLLVVLFGIYLANLVGPPPPDPAAIAVAGNASWLFVLWGYWIDRHRESRSPSP